MKDGTAKPGREKPDKPSLREKLLLWGEETLSDTELLALVLGVGRRGEGVESLAWRLLHEGGGLSGLSRADVHHLAGFRGVGKAQAARIAGIFALARRLHRQRGRNLARLTSARDVYRLVAGDLAGFPQERFLLLCLDGKNRVLRVHQVSQGTARTALVHPRDVFFPAIAARALAVVLVHNHPSGDPRPSREDLELTDRLRKGGELLGIEVLDHVIIGEGSYVSLAEGPEKVHNPRERS
ncbi:MAG TPA: JAB domain-containing protein [Planctomycetes bacterium]|nr:JAB domain-containing protein [Planctomycetota bacterium]